MNDMSNKYVMIKRSSLKKWVADRRRLRNKLLAKQLRVDELTRELRRIPYAHRLLCDAILLMTRFKDP